MDLFTEIKETLRLKVLEEYTTQELLAEIQRRKSMGSEPFEIYSNDHIKVLCMDAQGAGGAHHVYHTYLKDADIETDDPIDVISFQNGPIQENGVNGTQNEPLLAIIQHRLFCFQNGPYPSTFNAGALSGVIFAGSLLAERTKDRKERNVEGKNKA